MRRSILTLSSAAGYSKIRILFFAGEICNQLNWVGPKYFGIVHLGVLNELSGSSNPSNPISVFSFGFCSLRAADFS